MTTLASVSENILNQFSDIPSDTHHIYNLAGSSMSLFLALQKQPFIAVAQTEETAQRLYEDVQFFLSVLHGPPGDLIFLPDPNGPEASGMRAKVVQRIRGTESIITSTKSVQSPLWKPEDLSRDSLSLVPGQEMERDKLEERLRGLGYKRVSIVMDKGEYSAKGWMIDIFPVTEELPVRIEFFGDEIEHMKSFDIGSQRSVNRLDSLLIMPIEEPSSGVDITSIIDSRLILIDPDTQVNHEVSGPAPSGGDILHLTSFDIKGDGHNAGVRSMRGLGIGPDERKSFFDLTDGLKVLNRDARIIVVCSSEGQAERVKDILFEGGIIAPMIAKEELLGYAGTVAVTRGRLSSGFFLPGLLLLTEKEIFGERPPYRALKKSRVSELLATIDDIAPGDLVVHRDHGIGRFVGLQRQSSGGYESDLIVLE